mgnify:CR=1 FL=1
MKIDSAFLATLLSDAIRALEYAEVVEMERFYFMVQARYLREKYGIEGSKGEVCEKAAELRRSVLERARND